jgi:gluconolactonase
VDDLSFPEGPLVVNGKLHWVEYAGHRLMRLDGATKTVVHEQKGCGHNGLARAPGNQMVIVCYDSSELLYVDYDGNVLERIDKDSNGNPFKNPNDIVFDGEGGAYMATSGPFVAEPVAIVGGVFYRAPGTPTFTEVADSVHYGNGIALIDGGETLLVGEHSTNRILSFQVGDDGTLTDRSLFVRLSDLVPGPAQPSIWLGPDGMKVDQDGNIYVAHFLGSKVLKVSPEAKLLATFDIPAIGTTNVEFSESGDFIYVTGAEDISVAPYLGKIWKVSLE